MSVVGRSVGDKTPIASFQPVGLVGSDGYELGLVAQDGGLRVTQQEFVNVQVSYSKSDISATSWAVLIDLSDTVNWPHDPGDGIDISYMSLQVDKAANSLGRLQVGVVTRIDGTNGDVSVFRGIIFDKDDGAGRIDRTENFSPSQIRTEVVSGFTPYFLTSNRILNDTGLRTGLAIDSVTGTANVVPAVGDIVVRFLYTSGGSWNAAISALYHANPAQV